MTFKWPYKEPKWPLKEQEWPLKVQEWPLKEQEWTSIDSVSECDKTTVSASLSFWVDNMEHWGNGSEYSEDAWFISYQVKKNLN